MFMIREVGGVKFKIRDRANGATFVRCLECKSKHTMNSWAVAENMKWHSSYHKKGIA